MKDLVFLLRFLSWQRKMKKTPTKTYLHCTSIWQYLENICIQCGKEVVISQNLRRLFACETEKNKVGHNLELIFSDVLMSEVLGAAIHVICRACADRNETFAKKMFEERSNLDATKPKLDACYITSRPEGKTPLVKFGMLQE